MADARKMFKVSSSVWVNLSFVLRLLYIPAQSWGDDEERKPRLQIRQIGNETTEILEREAIEGGFTDITDLEQKLVAALEAYANG